MIVCQKEDGRPVLDIYPYPYREEKVWEDIKSMIEKTDISRDKFDKVTQDDILLLQELANSYIQHINLLKTYLMNFMVIKPSNIKDFCEVQDKVYQTVDEIVDYHIKCAIVNTMISILKYSSIVSIYSNTGKLEWKGE